MRRLALAVAALVPAALAAAALAGPASAQVRLATVVGVTGSLTATADFRGRWDQENHPDEKDACVQRRADVTYQLRMRGRGPVVEVDFRYPASIRPLITAVGNRSAKLRVTTRTSGSAESLPGQYSAFLNCGVQSTGFADDDEVASLTGFSPSRCSIAPAVYRLFLQGRALGNLEPPRVRYEDEVLGQCGWVVATGALPSLLGTAKGDWAQKRAFFADGAPGTTVAVTYRVDLDDDLADCPGTSAIITDACSETWRGTVTVRYRLGS